jgi:biopolymer transport protein ExbB
MAWRSRRSLLVLWTLAGSLAWSAGAQAWWNKDWNFRKPITVDTTAAGTTLGASLENPPVLIRLSLANFTYFKDTKPDGSDIRFIAGDDKTPLAFHVESYDPTAGMGFVWVKMPRLAPGTTETIYMYYGNASAPAGGDVGGTYDVNQALVYHFNGAQPADATSYKSNPSNSSAIANAGSVIGSGVRFDGAERIAVPASAALRLVPAQGLTVSVWVNVEQEQKDAVLVEGADPGGAFLTLAVDGLTPYVRVGDKAGVAETPRTTRLTPGSWHLLTATLGPASVVLYMDGERIAETPARLPEVGGEFSIGGPVKGDRDLFGKLDEVTVAKTARSADWVKAQFANQGPADKLLKYGEDAQREGSSKQSYFLITLQNVTVDGWVVIGVLVLMAMASWVIMITKGLTIRRVAGDNAKFSQEFRQAGTNIAALDREETAEDKELGEHPLLGALGGAHDHYQSSTLYHLYHVGLGEVRKRLAGAPVGADRATVLSSQSMDAIRATLDATNTRETQKLNSQMVLLTIAIAGGPFLGLLGTVVGVMITFAAIAASGDVNVNSIAPGIAAALAATVTGLGVAIPALFGYNYLASRIKEIIADNRVFIDELTTKLAEFYS